MRTIILTLTVLFIAGCAGTGSGKRNDTTAATGGIPVKMERPSILERQRVSQQKEAEVNMLGLTDVSGNVTR